mmetsp:Transcript_21826/g.45472  ORF Transcript_21826/g.45472 Transcript_21826/m.45472 type:complete len:286 (+) Transcript_21826:280-1137(+)
MSSNSTLALTPTSGPPGSPSLRLPRRTRLMPPPDPSTGRMRASSPPSRTSSSADLAGLSPPPRPSRPPGPWPETSSPSSPLSSSSLATRPTTDATEVSLPMLSSTSSLLVDLPPRLTTLTLPERASLELVLPPSLPPLEEPSPPGSTPRSSARDSVRALRTPMLSLPSFRSTALCPSPSMPPSGPVTPAESWTVLPAPAPPGRWTTLSSLSDTTPMLMSLTGSSGTPGTPTGERMASSALRWERTPAVSLTLPLSSPVSKECDRDARLVERESSYGVVALLRSAN